MRWVGEAAFPKEQKSEPRFALPNPGFCTKKNEARVLGKAQPLSLILR